jgi:DNA-directed RNA polymerase subunit beta'
LEAKGLKSLRVRLASPEQILSWSYGEVTKPETINYRRLRPEKDGLFCEAVFGPTRDWQCYCGKYKNIRYRGITCDKCGVEVTRSSVRRERMGHITLAAPVAHVWYARRVPSYMGLLLDVSRRDLDRVLYFAQYIITDIDEDAREKAIHRLEDNIEDEDKQQHEEVKAKIAAAQKYRDLRVEKLQARIDKINSSYENNLTKKLDPLLREAQDLQQSIDDERGNPAKKALRLKTASTTVVAKGETIKSSHLTDLNNAVQNRLQEFEATLKEKRDEKLASVTMDIETSKAEAEDEIVRQQIELEELTSQQQDRIAEDRDKLLNLQPMMFLSEAQYQDSKQKWGQVFSAGMGAEALYEILSDMNLDELLEELWEEIRTTKSQQRKKKATKRLKVVDAMRNSDNKPEWMILTELPVIPPDLRPMVQLDGGRFATSDLNDLYRRVINRNNRLKRLLDLHAPDVIIRNEKRMLQEAVDSLIDNAQRGKALSRRGRRELKSLSDMLKGKKGRFRRNLLGKRVDYSGRSVIVVGPKLKLNQCGLPKVMALELYKPFVMAKLVEYQHASNVKSAKRIIELGKPEVWEVLEEVIQNRPVLLNRAPTLHRLGIQAFEPVLVEGKAIHIHPLVCSAFNADFDGDQMAVHVPLSPKAVVEAYDLMLASRNLLKPADGEPIVGPSKDMVLGVYYMTMEKDGKKGEGRAFANIDEVDLAYSLGQLDLHTKIKLSIDTHFDDENSRYEEEDSRRRLVETTVGRALFNRILPNKMQYVNMLLDKTNLQDLVSRCYAIIGQDATTEVVDEIKNIGFKYATKSGTTIAISDITVPKAKATIVNRTEEEVADLEKQYQRGLLTEQEKTDATIQLWQAARKELEQEVKDGLDPNGNLSVMAMSGATKGGFTPISQLAGMRGLMADPAGRIIPLPIRSNFREGLRALEYFISTHGARKGLADTALRTADAGYLTRRLCDVAQDVIINGNDCETEDGLWINRKDDVAGQQFHERIQGRFSAENVVHPKTGELVIARNEELTDEISVIIQDLDIDRIFVRSPLVCHLDRGICAMCYGRDLGRGDLVQIGTAVGIISAQSIGEPGTQLTLRTFHTGGVAHGGDITSGLPRVEEIFEARKKPKGEAVVSEIDGQCEIIRSDDGKVSIRIVDSQLLTDEYNIPKGWAIKVEDADEITAGSAIATRGDNTTTAENEGKVHRNDRSILVSREHYEEDIYGIPTSGRILVVEGQKIRAGDSLTEGSQNPHRILRILGRESCELYLLTEVQQVYRSQGQNIHDKHFEVIIRKMLLRTQIVHAGDSDLLPGDYIDRYSLQETNEQLLTEDKEPAAGVPMLLGITKASLATDSFLSASSFQHTIRVLAGAAIESKIDPLTGLKENVIIGKLIPAGTGYKSHQPVPEVIEDSVVQEDNPDDIILSDADFETAKFNTQK